jgi:hypothetical protein
MPDLYAPLQGEDVVLAGPGLDGLQDLLQCVASSLVQVTVSLLLVSPGLQDIVVLRTLLLMADDVSAATLLGNDRREGADVLPATPQQRRWWRPKT